MFVRWAIACLPFIIITLLSVGFSGLRHYALSILSVGLVYLTAFYFIKSGRKTAMIMVPLVALIMGYAVQRALISLGLSIDEGAYMIFAQCLVITVALIKSEPRKKVADATMHRYFKREDAILFVLMGAVLSGIFFLLLEFADIVIDDAANLPMYDSYMVSVFFQALNIISLLGYASCLLAIIIYYSAPFIAKGFEWWFDLNKPKPTQPAQNS